MGMVAEFRDFIMKGSMIDMAVGLILGAGIGAVVGSVVSNMIMPVIGWALAGIDFSNLQVLLPLRAEQKPETQAAIKYGVVINEMIKLLAVGFFVFMAIKMVNKLKKPAPAAAPAGPPEDVVLLREIRDALKR